MALVAMSLLPEANMNTLGKRQIKQE